jgi:WD40 repeat protein
VEWEKVFSAENKMGGKRVGTVRFTSDGRFVAAGAAGGLSMIFDLAGQPIRTFEDFGIANVNSIAFSPDDRWLLIGCSDGVARMYKTQLN